MFIIINSSYEGDSLKIHEYGGCAESYELAVAYVKKNLPYANDVRRATQAEVNADADDDSGDYGFPCVTFIFQPDNVMNEAKARKVLGDTITEENEMKDMNMYTDWSPDGKLIQLDGQYEVDELEAMAWWMRNKAIEAT
jgi:hypothetical protein